MQLLKIGKSHQEPHVVLLTVIAIRKSLNKHECTTHYSKSFTRKQRNLNERW